jgi:hypothetical protein
MDECRFEKIGMMLVNPRGEMLSGFEQPARLSLNQNDLLTWRLLIYQSGWWV